MRTLELLALLGLLYADYLVRLVLHYLGLQRESPGRPRIRF